MIFRLSLCVLLVFVCTENVFGRLSRRRGSEIITLTGGGYGRRPIRIQRFCTRSDDCRLRRFRWFPACCRSGDGGILDPDLGGRQDPFLGRQGTCSIRKSGPGENCNDVCGCIRGYECYRTITGACCPPKTCWTKEAAQQDRDKWANCFPPDCFLPA